MHVLNKGKRGERAAAAALMKALGWEAYRAAQVSGKMGADLLGVPPEVHVEVKSYAKLFVANFMRQAMRDAKKGQLPIVLMKEDRGDFLVMVRLSDLSEFADVICQTRKLPEVREPQQPS